MAEEFYEQFQSDNEGPRSNIHKPWDGVQSYASGEVLRSASELRTSSVYDSHQIYNIDESGLSTVPTRFPKLVSPKGIRRVSKVVSGERGKNVTVVCGMSASGLFIPPFLLYPRKRMKTVFLIGTPPGTVGYCSESGWMTTYVPNLSTAFCEVCQAYRSISNSTAPGQSCITCYREGR